MASNSLEVCYMLKDKRSQFYRGSYTEDLRVHCIELSILYVYMYTIVSVFVYCNLPNAGAKGHCFKFDALKMDSFLLAPFAATFFFFITFQVLTALWEITRQPEKLVFHGKNQAFPINGWETGGSNRSTSGPWNCRSFSGQFP